MSGSRVILLEPNDPAVSIRIERHLSPHYARYNRNDIVLLNVWVGDFEEVEAEDVNDEETMTGVEVSCQSSVK